MLLQGSREGESTATHFFFFALLRSKKNEK